MLQIYNIYLTMKKIFTFYNTSMKITLYSAAFLVLEFVSRDFR